MHTLSVIAAEGIKNRDLWYPTILGVLVVVAAVALFCGTPYLLLATNMGVATRVPRRHRLPLGAPGARSRCSGSPTRRR